jgi:hypothetical protein
MDTWLTIPRWRFTRTSRMTCRTTWKTASRYLTPTPKASKVLLMNEHEHKFQVEGDTWACFGWPGACGLRAPACFTPKEQYVTHKGLIDLALAGVFSFSTLN